MWTLRECSALVPGLGPTRGASAAWAPGPFIYCFFFVLNWILWHTQRTVVYACLPIIREALLSDAQGGADGALVFDWQGGFYSSLVVDLHICGKLLPLDVTVQFR